MSPERVAVVCPYYFFNPPIGTPQRTRFLQRWRERSETGDLDHCVMVGVGFECDGAETPTAW
jgi:hypothetical protein